MNEPAVVQQGGTVQSSVVSPTRTIPKEPYSSHGFFNVIRDIVHRGNVYHSEVDQNAALDAIDKHEQHQLAENLPYVISDTDRAGREDVTLRTPPGGAVLPNAVATQGIDYDKLAAAIVRAQNAQPAPPPVVATITDVPEGTQDGTGS